MSVVGHCWRQRQPGWLQRQQRLGWWQQGPGRWQHRLERGLGGAPSRGYAAGDAPAEASHGPIDAGHGPIDAGHDPVAAAALQEIGERLSRLKAAELAGIMRQCGLAQGTTKAHKAAALGAFIWSSQALAQRRYAGQRRRAARKAATAHAAFVADEVVSIDIGFRNLAFAHVSRDGRVLAWRRVELLGEATFEPWTLAAVVERFVRSVLPIRPAAKCTYIIEHQRFRSQGSASVTDSVMVNNLVEALLYANLRHCGVHVEPVNPTLVSVHWQLSAAWEAQAGPEEAAPAQDRLGKKADAAQAIARMDRLLEEQRQTTGRQQDALARALGLTPPRRRSARAAGGRDLDGLLQRGAAYLGSLRDTRRRLVKKERSVALVQSWILAFLGAESAAPPAHGAAADTWPFSPRRHLAFSAEMARAFYAEKKKDDLCDCILQAAAWYHWQRAVPAILDAYGSMQLARPDA